MDPDIPTFGKKEDGLEYTFRPGGYLVVKNEIGAIAAVRSEKGFYLPGGGLDDGESPEAAAIREAGEECGMRVEIDGEIGTADEFIFVEEENTHFQKRGTFFSARPISVDRGGDHELVWLPRTEAIEKLKHESQRWAVERSPAP